MQVIPFSNGGFVAHKVAVPGSPCRHSAWYDSNGKLLDAEAFDRLNRPRSVRKNGPAWTYLASIAQRIAPVK